MPRRNPTPTQPPAPADGPTVTDLVPGEPPVPITVWRTPDGDDRATIPPTLAARLVSAYSNPGQALVDLTDNHALTTAAGEGGRRHHPGWFTDASALIIGPPTPAQPRPHQERPVQPAARRRRGGHDGEPAELAAWFGDDLTDPDLPPPGTSTPADVGSVLGATSLLVACWPLDQVAARHRRRLRWLLHGGEQLLRPGGCLVLIVRGDPRRPAAPEDFTPLLDAARTVGLGYLQHIVAVRAPIDGDQFTYHATDTELAALAAAGQLAVAHLRVHADLLVFTPHAPTASAGGGEVRG